MREELTQTEHRSKKKEHDVEKKEKLGIEGLGRRLEKRSMRTGKLEKGKKIGKQNVVETDVEGRKLNGVWTIMNMDGKREGKKKRMKVGNMA